MGSSVLVFGRFTERGRQVVVFAHQEALALGHDYIETEHILLALLHENEGVAALVLVDFEADAQQIRHEVLHALTD